MPYIPFGYLYLCFSGISYEEAREMVEGDLLLRRMMGVRVNIKAQQRIGPRELRRAYEEYAESNKRPTEWVFQVITIRNSNAEKGAAAANILRNILVGKQETIEELAKHYQDISAIDSNTKVSFSEEYRQNENDVSEAYQETLKTMKPDSFSQPIAQQSRGKNETVHRIFYLKTTTPGGMIPFAEVETELQNKLIGEAINAETEIYLNRLRKQSGLTKENMAQTIPADFQPFVLK